MLELVLCGRIELGDGCLDCLRTANEVGEQLFVDFQAALVFSEIPLVVSFKEDLHVGRARAERVHESLKNGNPVFGSIRPSTAARV